MTEKERLPFGRRSDHHIIVSSCFGAQTTNPIRFIPLFQQLCQRGEKFLLQIVHAAAVHLMRFRIPADGQAAIYEPLPEIILVWSQNRFQGTVQELQVLFQFGKVASGDGSKSFFFHAEAIFVPVEVVVLTEIFCVGVIGRILLILTSVVCFIRLQSLPFTNRPTEALFLQPLYGFP